MQFTMKPLTDEQVKDYFNKAYEIIERVGYDIPHANTLKLLKDMGCTVEGTNVKIPAKFIEDAWKQVPRKFEMLGSGNYGKVQFGNGDLHMGAMFCSAEILNEDMVTRHATTRQDKIDFLKLADSYDKCHLINEMIVCDVESDWHTMKSSNVSDLLLHTDKPKMSTMFTWGHDMMEEILNLRGESLKDGIRMLQFTEIKTPLATTFTSMDILEHSRANGWYQAYGAISCDLMGMTAPVRATEQALLTFTEFLVMNFLTQLYLPGVPFGAYHGDFQNDFSNMAGLEATPENQLCDNIVNQLCRAANFTNFSVGGMNDAPIFNAQTGSECALSMIEAISSGADVIVATGELEGRTAMSKEKWIFDEELQRQFLATIKPVEDLRDDIIDYIEAIGPNGNFLNTKEVRKFYRKGFYKRDAFTGMTFAEATERDYELSKVLHAKVEERLANWVGPEYTDEQRAKIEEIRLKYIPISEAWRDADPNL